jgi:NAD(P)-dependent dehydrogenase (short-subunit alcohol dehydrogenase family)
MKTALVTGASGNMGQAVIRQLIADGYFVFGTLIPNDPVHTDFPPENFKGIEANLSDEAAASSMIQTILTEKKSVDAAILTVGGFAMGDIANTSSADILKQYKLNFETTYHVARPVFTAMMKAGKGRIFLVGSKPGSGMEKSKGMVAYGLAKSLIFRLAELMNGEAAGKNVVTSVIVPSTIDTPQNRKSMPDADFSKWVKPESIAKVVSFYCSDDAADLREPLIRIFNNS